MQTIKLKRGLEANIPTLQQAELGYTTDSDKLFIGNGLGNTLLSHQELFSGFTTNLHYHDSDRDRSNHTGTQLSNTISDFNSSVNSLISSASIDADSLGGVSAGNYARLDIDNEFAGSATLGTGKSLSIKDGTFTARPLLYIEGGVTATLGNINLPTNIKSNGTLNHNGNTILDITHRGVANGVASLDGSGLIPTSQLPSYVDDVIEVTTLPGTGDSGKIYVRTTDETIWRWSGSAFIQISPAVGTADEALKLATARTIQLSGDATGFTLFDGSENVIISTTVNNSDKLSGLNLETGSIADSVVARDINSYIRCAKLFAYGGPTVESISIGANGNGDSTIAFHDDTNDAWREFKWDDSESDWGVHDSSGVIRKLYHAGNESSINAGQLSGLTSSQFLRSDADTEFSGGGITLWNNRWIVGKNNNNNNFAIFAIGNDNNHYVGHPSINTYLRAANVVTGGNLEVPYQSKYRSRDSTNAIRDILQISSDEVYVGSGSHPLNLASDGTLKHNGESVLTSTTLGTNLGDTDFNIVGDPHASLTSSIGDTTWWNLDGSARLWHATDGKDGGSCIKCVRTTANFSLFPNAGVGGKSPYIPVRDGDRIGYFVRYYAEAGTTGSFQVQFRTYDKDKANGLPVPTNTEHTITTTGSWIEIKGTLEIDHSVAAFGLPAFWISCPGTVRFDTISYQLLPRLINADLLKGYSPSTDSAANTIVARDGSGNIIIPYGAKYRSRDSSNNIWDLLRIVSDEVHLGSSALPISLYASGTAKIASNNPKLMVKSNDTAGISQIGIWSAQGGDAYAMLEMNYDDVSNLGTIKFNGNGLKFVENVNGTETDRLIIESDGTIKAGSNNIDVGIWKLISSELTTGNSQLINAGASNIWVGNPNTALDLQSSSNPTMTVGASTYTAYHTGNDTNLAKINTNNTFQGSLTLSPPSGNANIGLNGATVSDLVQFLFQRGGSTRGRLQYVHDAVATNEKIHINVGGSSNTVLTLNGDGSVDIPTGPLNINSSEVITSGGTQSITGTKTFDADIVIEYPNYIRVKDSVGTLRTLATLNNDVFTLAGSAYPTNILSDGTLSHNGNTIWDSANFDPSTKIDVSQKGVINGVATLDASGLVPSSQLPSYVDDVIEVASLPGSGETGKIYVVTGDGSIWRWSGSAFIEIGQNVSQSDYALNSGLLDNLDSSQFVRSDTSDDLSGVYTFSSSSAFPIVINGSNNGKLDLRGSGSPYIQFRDGANSRGYIIWQASSSAMEIANQLDNSRIRIKDDIDFTQDGVTYYSLYHEGNSGNLAKIGSTNTFSEYQLIRGFDADIIIKSQNKSAGNADQFELKHNGGEVQLKNNRGALRLLPSNGYLYFQHDNPTLRVRSTNTSGISNIGIYSAAGGDTHAMLELYYDDTPNQASIKFNANGLKFVENNNGVESTQVEIGASGALFSNQDLYVGQSSGGDSFIHFYDNTNSTWRSLKWGDANSDWYVEDSTGATRKLVHSGNDDNYAQLDSVNIYEVDQRIQNTRYFSGYEVGNITPRNLAGINASNQVVLGDISNSMRLYSSSTPQYYNGTSSYDILHAGYGEIPNSTSGNAATATKLATARTITLSGDVDGSTSFDGSGNVTITTSANGDYFQSQGLSGSWGQTSGVNTGAFNAIMGTASSATWLLSGTSGGVFRGGVQLLDTGNTMRLYTNSNYISITGSTIGASLAGNASTATTLETARTLSLTGGVSGSTSFDGSANVSISAVVADDSHNHTTYLPLTGGVLTGGLQVGNNVANTILTIQKPDNNIADHIRFYLGSTRVGEIGADDEGWLKLNGVTDKGVYTPRILRADGGFQVDNKFVVSADGNTLYENEVALSNKYLGISSKAADSELLDGINSTKFPFGDNDYANKQVAFTDINFKSGFFEVINNNTDAPTTNGYWQGAQFRHNNASNTWGWQLVSSYAESDIFYRSINSGSYGNWRKIWHSDDPTITANLNGNANTASKWATARTLSLTGDVTGSASVDGSGNVSIATTMQGGSTLPTQTGNSGKVLGTDGSTASWKKNNKIATYYYEATAQDETLITDGVYFKDNVVIESLSIFARVAPTDNDLTIKITLDGSEQTGTATLTDGNNYQTTTLNQACTTSQRFGLKIKSIGTTEPGQGITITVNYYES